MFVENQHSVHQLEMHSHVSERMRTQAVNLVKLCNAYARRSSYILDFYVATVEKQVHRALLCEMFKRPNNGSSRPVL